jgi:hypothetical protein
MNERIKELAEQAGVYFGEAHVDYFGDEHPSYISTREMDVEKFAELIIRECARSVTWYTKEERNWPNNGQVVRANKTVLEHFGVEE